MHEHCHMVFGVGRLVAGRAGEAAKHKHRCTAFGAGSDVAKADDAVMRKDHHIVGVGRSVTAVAEVKMHEHRLTVFGAS